jgi:hypothetical protein
MLKRLLVRSVATSAAVGTVVALAGVTTPATVSSSPAIESVACQQSYPNPIASSTDVRMDNAFQAYGAVNTVRVDVNANVGNPTGSVRITVARRSWTVPLSGGRASKVLPRRMLDAGRTYRVSARFLPNCNTGEYATSRDDALLTVMRAGTRVRDLDVNNIRRGGKPHVTANIRSNVAPGGKARVTISKGHKRRTRTVPVRKVSGNTSRVSLWFGRVNAKGTWTVKVKYLGNRNFTADSASTTFRVKRR